MSITEDPIAFQSALLSWYRDHRRSLPWRETASLYRTVVSEFMLQQTQVKTMLPYFARWMERFPDFQTLAKADESTVLKLWEGLGYYSRARNLHRLARELEVLPTPPRTSAEWEHLPGIGPYTAAAISSIAQHQPAAVVDGNVVRILARLLGVDQSFSSAEAVTYFRPVARSVLNLKAPGDHNQAMMELGATVCQKHQPLCTVCPVVQFCRAAAEGRVAEIPNLRKKNIIMRSVERIFLRRDDAVLFHRIPEEARRLAGQYELPEAGILATLDVGRGELLLEKSRSIANERIREHIHAGVRPANGLQVEVEGANLHWIKLNDLERITLSGPHRRWVRQLVAERK